MKEGGGQNLPGGRRGVLPWGGGVGEQLRRDTGGRGEVGCAGPCVCGGRRAGWLPGRLAG